MLVTLPIKWKVEEEIFFDKKSSLKKSALLKTRPTFILGNNDIWKSIVPVNFNIDNLYKQRALMLREKYKKIRLFFSGGSDSHNILMTFLKNNIQIDEIVVRWSLTALDRRFHNTYYDTSASSNLHEWDFAIKPVLDYISKEYPNIKITIENFTSSKLNKETNFTVNNIISVLEKNQFVRGTLGSILQRIGRTEETLFDDSIANVFGVEKPILFFNSKKYYFAFNDLSFEMFTGHGSGVPEPFYWSIDFPELPVSQAYLLANYYKVNPELNVNLLSNLYEKDGRKKIHMQNKIAKRVLYKYWNNNTFQADKPNFYRDDWWGWLEKSLPIDECTINKNFTIASNEFYQDCLGSKGLMNPHDNLYKPRPFLPTAIFTELYEIKI